MAHFVQLDDNDVVLRILVVNDDYITKDGVEVEQLGIDKLKSIYGQETNWLQTSFNNRIRVRYGRVGFSYNRSLDAFIPPKPHPSWVLDDATADWVAPFPLPDDAPSGFRYVWDEEELQWVLTPTTSPV